MSGDDEDDKPTVVLDLNALKKQKLKQEEDLANIASELEFSIPEEPVVPVSKVAKPDYPVILFDFQSDFFRKSQAQLPTGYNYKIVSTLAELNECLKYKSFQLVLLNYDVNPKAVNTLSAQIKAKFPHTKVMIMARAISPEKAKAHAKTPSGAHGYYQFPLSPEKVESEFEKIRSLVKKAS